MSPGTILIVVLVLVLLFGGIPGPWSAGNPAWTPYWGTGYYGGGGISLVVVVLLILVLLGRL